MLYKKPIQDKLMKKWGALIESKGVSEIVGHDQKVKMAMILENTHKWYKDHYMLNEAGIAQTDVVGTKAPGATVLTGKEHYPYRNAGETGAYGDYYLPNVVIPMLRRIMPDLIANELVAVQPLQGPIGYALAYRPTYGKFGAFDTSKTDVDGREIGFNPTDTSWTGQKDGTLSVFGETLADGNDNDFWKAYAGTETTTSLTGDAKDNWHGTGKGIGVESEYATLGQNYPTVSFGLVKSAVEAKTRKLAAHWSPELAEDMQAMHGINVEDEMMNTITFEVGAEIDRQIINDMVKAAIVGGSTTTWTPLSADGLDQMGRLATLLTQITIEAQQIAVRTRRGNANFVVTTPRVCALLQQLSMNKFTSFKNSAAMPTVPDTGVGALAKVGLINDDQQLLVRDSYAAQGANDYVLMGYKGKQAGDSGIIYCPYVPLQLQKVLQPGSFTPSIGARTRYGIMNNPYDARNYYTFMKISDLYGQYTWQGTRQFIAEPTKIDNGTVFNQ